MSATTIIAGIELTIFADSTCKKEITSWVEPIVIDHAPVSPADVKRHDAIAQQRRKDKMSCTSHTVFVVDQSGYVQTTLIILMSVCFASAKGVMGEECNLTGPHHLLLHRQIPILPNIYLQLHAFV